MMESLDVKKLGMIFSIYAKIEGMKWENEKLRQYDEPPKHTIEFDLLSRELENIVHANEEQFDKLFT